MSSNTYKLIFTLFSLAAPLLSWAQQDSIRVRGGFLDDSVMIGRTTAYSLTVQYPSSQKVLFPDSTGDFFPFTFSEKKYFPTVTKGSVSRDSAVYYLKTFEIAARQPLQLPVYVVQPADCTRVLAQTDTIFLQSLVKIPDSLLVDQLEFKSTTAYVPIKRAFNYPILLIAGGALVVVFAGIWLVFGEQIKRYFRRKRLQEAYDQFSRQYASALEQMRRAATKDTAASTLTLWKMYMEQLDARPYTKLTTRETHQLVADEGLGDNLKAIDRVIYGHQHDALAPLEQLGAYARSRFLEKIETLTNGERTG